VHPLVRRSIVGVAVPEDGSCLASAGSAARFDVREERAMPDRRSEGTKKHGDELESLIDRATGGKSAGQGHSSADDPTEFQDDDDEDVHNDDRDDRRDVGKTS
jgi:hypothetical protein